MAEQSERGPAGMGLLLPLALANGVAVSTLYWGQAVVARAVEQFGRSATLSVMPGATLAGYAVGVAGLATIAGDLTRPRTGAWHFALLAAASCAAAAAPVPAVLTASCFVLGVGCALTQRLLATATSAVAPERRPRTIAWIIAAGLLGIVAARSCVPVAAELFGWRGVFWMDAALAAVFGTAATWATARLYRPGDGKSGEVLPGALTLWRREAPLRTAALQQGLVFAGFNMGWAIFAQEVQRLGSRPAVLTAAVALLGAAAALISGRLCGRLSVPDVADAGALAVAVAAGSLALGWDVPVWWLFGMALLDAGTQVALVANQARAQALAENAAMRGRLAAIVTTIGFMGGAVGSAVGNLLVWTGVLS